MKQNICSIFNAIWKVGLGLFGLTALIIGILIAICWYENRYGRSYWRDQDLSKNVVVRGYNSGRVRVYNKKEGKYLSPKLNWISSTPRFDSLTVYADKHGYRGYLNCNTGKIVIPANKGKYRHAWHFSGGRAFVMLPDSDSLSVIDHDGNIVVRNVAPYRYGNDYVFDWLGLCELEKDGRTGLLALDGTWAIEPKYFSIETRNTFGYRLAHNEKGDWLFDPDHKLVYSEPYDKLEFAIGHEEGTGTLYRTRNHIKELVNYDGSVVEPFVIDGTYNLRYMVKYNTDGEDDYALDPDLVVYRVDEWEGLMNKHTGRPVTRAIYTDFEMISKELIKADLSYNDGIAVVMNRTGHIVKHQ